MNSYLLYITELELNKDKITLISNELNNMFDFEPFLNKIVINPLVKLVSVVEGNITINFEENCKILSIKNTKINQNIAKYEALFEIHDNCLQIYLNNHTITIRMIPV